MIRIFITCIFFSLLALGEYRSSIPFGIGALYTLMSLISFFVYAKDKSAAVRCRWRTPERVLHTLALLCGWPGALVAQHTLKHKSRKMSFMIVFFVTVSFNLILLAIATSPKGKEVISQKAFQVKELVKSSFSQTVT